MAVILRSYGNHFRLMYVNQVPHTYIKRHVNMQSLCTVKQLQYEADIVKPVLDVIEIQLLNGTLCDATFVFDPVHGLSEISM